VPAHCVPEEVVKQLQLNSRGLGVGCMVGTGTGVKSGVATTPGTLVSCDGAPGKIGTEGCVSGGGPGGGAGTCAWPTPAIATSASAITIARRAPEEELEQAPEMAVGKILIAKNFSSDDARALCLPRERPRVSAGARSYDPEAGRALQARRVWAKVPMRASLDARCLRNAPPVVSSLCEVSG
jgi:hypothetical protein